METTWNHATVLLNEAVDALFTDGANNFADAADGTYVDATFGRGGHSRLILSRLSPQGRLIAFDKDPQAVAESAAIADPRFSIRHEGFAHLGDLPAKSVTGLLMDLGVSSPQIDNPARDSVFVSKVRWICAWIPRAERVWRNGWQQQKSIKSRR